MQKFLVIQTAFTGDVVLATALIEKLHKFFPDASIDMLVRKGNEGLLTAHPFLNEVLIWNKKEKKLKNLRLLLTVIRKKKYDKVINLQRFTSTGILTAFSGAKEKIGFDKNPLSIFFTKKISHHFEKDIHEVERNNQLIKDFTDDSFVKPKLYPSQKNEEEVRPYTFQPYVCMMPASVWFTKQYPKEKWIDLINNFPSEYAIFLLGGKEDVQLCESIKSESGNKKVEVLAGKLNFLSSAALMRGAKMSYSNDSAPLHFASATDAPVTAIFCSTIPAFGFYPLSTKSFIVQTDLPLACKPCSLHGLKACPLGHFKCARTIETEKLLDTLTTEI
jgi:heptosyltransferase-2